LGDDVGSVLCINLCAGLFCQYICVDRPPVLYTGLQWVPLLNGSVGLHMGCMGPPLMSLSPQVQFVTVSTCTVCDLSSNLLVVEQAAGLQHVSFLNF
jgi:hypothetical protein